MKAAQQKKLHETYLPESLRRVLEQLHDVDLLFIERLGKAVVGGILLRIPFLHLHRGVNHAEYQDGCTDIKRPYHRVGHHALGSLVGNADGRKEKREDKADYRTGIAEEALNAVGQSFLLLVHHVADKHLKRLHGHVDARVEKHERHKAEYHGSGNSHAKRTGIGKQAHDKHGKDGSDEEIGNAAAEARPSLVRQSADNGLHQDAHERRQYPEIAQRMRVGSQRRKDS